MAEETTTSTGGVPPAIEESDSNEFDVLIANYKKIQRFGNQYNEGDIPLDEAEEL